jgi:hypothetical protein
MPKSRATTRNFRALLLRTPHQPLNRLEPIVVNHCAAVDDANRDGRLRRGREDRPNTQLAHAVGKEPHEFFVELGMDYETLDGDTALATSLAAISWKRCIPG